MAAPTDRPLAAHGTWTESKRDGWTYDRTPDPRPVNPQSFPEDPRVNRAMAKLTAERGYLNLSQAHALAAQDCGRGCPCEGCRTTRLEREAEKAEKQARASRARRNAA